MSIMICGKIRATFTYIYDMGDYWQHTVTVEKRTMVVKDLAESLAMDGENACPPEDCGGIHEFAEMDDPSFDRTLFDIRSAQRILWMLDFYGKGYPWMKE